MPITQKTLDFLFENRMRDSRTWFHEHHDTYLQLVREPVYRLIADIAPTIIEIDPTLVTVPARVMSRVNRDLRFSRDKSLYRDVVWISFKHRREDGPNGPSLYFEFSPSGMDWGCGYYHAHPKVMACMRELILEGNKTFEKANKLIRAGKFALEGDCYKRSRFPDQPEELRNWLDRKSVYVGQSSDDFGLLFSDGLAEHLAGAFRELAPVYRFFREAEARVVHN